MRNFTLYVCLLLAMIACKKEDNNTNHNGGGNNIGTIQALSCYSAVNNGTLTKGIPASGVSSVVYYFSGTGGTHSGQTVTSTGVAGLTATLAAGTFANGNGSLTYTITGTPASSGTANFTLSIGGQTCTLTRTVAGGVATCGAASVHNAALTYGTMTDQDGNVYKTIQIGTQTWMAENLKASHYRNGEPIALVTDSTAWSALSTGAACWYNNDSATYNCPYGKLYNWYAVTDARSVCPTGWHVSTDAEWTVLKDNLAGPAVAGGKMKSTGTSYWLSPNTDADNSSGFSGLPGGARFKEVKPFFWVRDMGFWWRYDAVDAIYSVLSSGNGYMDKDSGDKLNGYSVRCLKD